MSGGLNQGRSEAIRRLVELGLEGEEMSRVEKAVPQICLCDAPKEQRKMEYEEILTSLELGPPTAIMRNFSIDCPVHGPRTKQVEGHHISVKPPREERFSKYERKVIGQKLTGR